MDKKLTDQLQSDAEVIKSQKDELSKQAEAIETKDKRLVELEKFELAHKIAEEMVFKEMIAPEDFQEKLGILRTKSAEELNKRKDVLAIRDVDSVLELGTVDQGDGKLAATPEKSKSPSPHSQESQDAADKLIHTMITE